MTETNYSLIVNKMMIHILEIYLFLMGQLYKENFPLSLALKGLRAVRKKLL